MEPFRKNGLRSKCSIPGCVSQGEKNWTISGKVLSICIIALLLCIVFGAGAWYLNTRYSRIARQLRYAEKDLMVRLVEDFAQSPKPVHKNAVKMLTRTLRFLKGRNRLEKPYLVSICLTRHHRRIPDKTSGSILDGDATHLDLTFLWLEDGFHTKGLKAKITTSEGTEQIIELPVYGHCMTEYWDDDMAELYNKSALRSQGLWARLGETWKLEETKPRNRQFAEALKKYGIQLKTPPSSSLPKDVVIPAEALKNPILICVYDDKGNESNWVELFVDEEVLLSIGEGNNAEHTAE